MLALSYAKHALQPFELYLWPHKLQFLDMFYTFARCSELVYVPDWLRRLPEKRIDTMRRNLPNGGSILCWKAWILFLFSVIKNTSNSLTLIKKNVFNKLLSLFNKINTWMTVCQKILPMSFLMKWIWYYLF